jgi:hypothetical protein
MTRHQDMCALEAGEMRSECLRLIASTFDCWLVLPNGKAMSHHIQGDTLAEIERSMAKAAYHGETILVRETETLSGKTTLHTYRVRKGKPIAWDADARRVYFYTAEKLVSVEVSAFQPVAPFRHTPGCDVIGFGNVIEGGRK